MTTSQHRGEVAAEDVHLPLPMYEHVDLPPLTVSGKTFKVSLGLSQKLVADLKERSLDMSDVLLQRNSSDFSRFGTGSYEKWYQKGRIPFALVDEKGVLAALIWFGAQAYPADVESEDYQPTGEEWDTIAFRSYEPYRGKGLMTPFGSLVMSFFAKHRPGRKLWLEVYAENEAGVSLYKKLGFTARGIRRKNKRLVMTKE